MGGSWRPRSQGWRRAGSRSYQGGAATAGPEPRRMRAGRADLGTPGCKEGDTERTLGEKARSGAWGSGAERREEPGRGFDRRSECLGESWGEGKATRPLPGRPGLQDETGRGDRRGKSRGTRSPTAEAARWLGGPNPPSGGPGHSGEETGDAGALTGVPPHGAAGGVRPQVREEEVPGGLEVLEVAELDDGAGHGCGERGSATHLTSLATPCTPPPSPHRLSHRGRGHPAGSCQHTRVPPPARCACAPGRVT